VLPNRWIRGSLYAALVVLLATGVAWLVLEPLHDPFQPDGGGAAAAWLLAVHGGAAMAFLLLLGALIPLHIQGNWSRDRNRWTGVVMLAVNAALIVTAYALYYSGSDWLRGWASDLHIAAGFFLPLWVGVHVWLGRRARLATQRALANADWE
jgi:hypothetical protein